VDDDLTLDLTEGATLRGKEYGSRISEFPNALSKARVHGYACLGGQFQFRLDDGSTCEMYWLAADSNDRADDESWTDYSQRSCSEVLQAFRRLVSDTDFRRESAKWPVQIDPETNLVFVAYFVSETDWARLLVRDSMKKFRDRNQTRMKNEQHDPEWYLRDRRVRRWMVQCVGCRRWGYRHDAPPKFHGRVQLEKHIGELNLDERGLCAQCREASSGDGSSPHQV
jgi:hypothetical protein